MSRRNDPNFVHDPVRVEALQRAINTARQARGEDPINTDKMLGEITSGQAARFREDPAVQAAVRDFVDNGHGGNRAVRQGLMRQHERRPSTPQVTTETARSEVRLNAGANLPQAFVAAATGRGRTDEARTLERGAVDVGATIATTQQQQQQEQQQQQQATRSQAELVERVRLMSPQEISNAPLGIRDGLATLHSAIIDQDNARQVLDLSTNERSRARATAMITETGNTLTAAAGNLFGNQQATTYLAGLPSTPSADAAIAGGPAQPAPTSEQVAVPRSQGWTPNQPAASAGGQATSFRAQFEASAASPEARFLLNTQYRQGDTAPTTQSPANPDRAAGGTPQLFSAGAPTAADIARLQDTQVAAVQRRPLGGMTVN